MSPELAFALDLAYRAGRQTLPLFGKRLDPELKADLSPVTVADKEAERLMRGEIEAKYPMDRIFGEEEGESGVGERRWVIDPIDGTRSFISGVPLYSTLLSLEVGGDPVLGVAYFPALDWMVYASSGNGAYDNGAPARVSTISDLSLATVCTSGIGGLAKQGRLAAAEQIAGKVAITRTWCDAHGHMMVATGRAEAMIDAAVAHYDISAVAVIVREAGGTFTDLHGNPVLGTNAMSTNGLVHSELLEMLNS